LRNSRKGAFHVAGLFAFLFGLDERSWSAVASVSAAASHSGARGHASALESPRCTGNNNPACSGCRTCARRRASASADCLSLRAPVVRARAPIPAPGTIVFRSKRIATACRPVDCMLLLCRSCLLEARALRPLCARAPMGSLKPHRAVLCPARASVLTSPPVLASHGPSLRRRISVEAV
jgi:hypothetical protein